MHWKALMAWVGPVRVVRFVDDADRTRPRQPEQRTRPGSDDDVHGTFACGLIDGGTVAAQAGVVGGHGMPRWEYEAQEFHQPLDRPYFGGKHQGLISISQCRSYYGRYRVPFLTPGRLPQESAAVLYGAARGSRERISPCGTFTAGGQQGRWLGTAHEPHRAPADQLPQGAPAGARLREQRRGGARTPTVFQGREQVSLAWGTGQVRFCGGTDQGPLHHLRPWRRGR